MKILIAFVAAILAVIGTPACAQTGDDLVGIWRSDGGSASQLHGRLLVRKSPTGFVATIGDLRAASKGSSELRFSFGRNGSFRGRLVGPSLEGFWVQQSDDRGRSNSSYATPVHMRQISADAWSGEVAPFGDRFTLWLSIFRAPDGSLTGAFRNPQANSTGGAPRFGVSRSGTDLLFSATAGDRTITHSASFLARPERIRIEWPDAGRTLELSRRSGNDAGAFFPRPPSSPPYVYRRPLQLLDGWRTARASSVGIDKTALRDIVRDIAASDPTVRGPRLMHSILVAHRGKLVLEEYFYGFDRLTAHDMRSASKTFASVMLGTAPARDAGLSQDSRIYQVMRPLGPFAHPDPRKSQITLANLLTHTSGLACNDNDDTSPGNEETMQTQKSEPDWWRYTLNLPQVFEPGTRYAYCSGNTNLVGGALTTATHSWLPELFRRTIAEPLQFGEWHWLLMPNGEGYAGGGVAMLPRDLLKVGQLYLDGGLWNGRRIVPVEWVELSIAPHVQVTPQTTGLTDDEFSNFYLRAADGLAWHLLDTLKSGGRTYRTYGATGNGGQLLIVVPEADLVVVFTGGNYSQGGVWLRWPQQIVGDKIIPAMHLPN